jgi:hypothetical protein
MLPTPLAGMKDQVNTEAYDQRMQRLIEKGHKPFTMPLDQMAIKGMLPTPNSRDYKGAQTPEKYEIRKEMWAEKGINLQLGLPQVINNANGTTSQLNPRFVAEMMGFPPNWTELPFQSGEQNQ